MCESKNMFSVLNSQKSLPCILSRNVVYAILMALVLGWMVPSVRAQGPPGFLGYLLNSTDGTVSIFATESDDSRIGNNDHLIGVVTLDAKGSNPQRIAVTPDGQKAFVSSPANGAVYMINVADPTNPVVTNITSSFKSLGTPGGIAVTSVSATEFHVWVADSKNCDMHVWDTSTSTEVSSSPFTLSPPTPNSTTTASCAAGIAFPEVISTPDQLTAVFASFNLVQFTDSSTNPPSVTAPAPYIYAFDPTLTTTNPAPLKFGSSITLTDPRTLTAIQDTNNDVLLFIGDFGTTSGVGIAPAVFVSGISPTSLAVAGPETTVVSGVQPVALTTNNLDGIPSINGKDSRTDTAFYLFVGEGSGALGVFSIDCGSTSCTSTLTVAAATTATLSGIPSSLGAVPSSAKSDGRASIIYVTESSGPKPVELVLGEGPNTGTSFTFGTPCVVGTANCGGATVAGGQVYDTAVPVGNGPVGAAFGPLYDGAPAITWLTGYRISSTGTGTFTPIQPAPTSASVQNVLVFADQNTPLNNIEFQALSMVSNVTTQQPTLNATASVVDAANPNYGCPGSNSSCGASGQNVQTTQFNVNGTSSTTTVTGAGDVATITFTGENTCIGFTITCSTTPRPSITSLKTKALCTLFINGSALSTVNVFAGSSTNSTVNAELSCTGPPSDTINGTITWGFPAPPATSATSSVSLVTQGSAAMLSNQSMSPSYTPAGTPYTISAAAVDATGSNYAVTVQNNNVSVTVLPTYSVSGTISGPGGAGATVTLTTTGSTVPPVLADGSGNFSFPGLLNGSYTVTPAHIGFTFTPTSATAVVNGANVTNVNFATVTYVISGNISGTGGPGSTVTLTTAGGTVPPVMANGSGNFSFPSLLNGSYTVTPTHTGFTFSPTSSAVVINGSNVANVNFAATASTTTNYSISGTISGAGGNAATVTLTGPTPGTSISTGAGAYSFSGLSNGSYTVTPTKSGYGFSPATQSVSVANANVANVNFNSIAPPSCAFNPATLPSSPANQQVTATIICQGNPGDSLSGSIPNWGDGSSSPATTASVGNSGSATFSFAHTYANPSPSGNPYSISAAVTDLTTSLPASAIAAATIVVTTAAMNPTITPNATSFAIVAGQSFMFKLGFQGNSTDANLTLAISCQGLPQGTSCSYTPNPFVLNSNGVNTAVLTVTTTAPSTAALLPGHNMREPRIFASILFAPLIFGLLITTGHFARGRDERYGRISSITLLLVIGLMVGMVACGTKVSQTPLLCPGCTPNGTFTFNVVATSQQPALQSSVSLQVQIGPGQ
jgi:hypothetical protein